jgi:hypothetical protein
LDLTLFASACRKQGYPLVLDRTLARLQIQLIRDLLPIRIKVYHICAPFCRPPFNYLLPVLRHMMGKDCRRRFVVHIGNPVDIHRSLARAPYHTPLCWIPLSLQGEFDALAALDAWVEDRTRVEAARDDVGS